MLTMLLNWMFRPFLFSFADENAGGGAGGGDNADPNAGGQQGGDDSEHADPKKENDGQQGDDNAEVETVESLKKKYEGVDVERYKKIHEALGDLDLDKFKRDKELIEAIAKDEDLFNEVIAKLKAKKTGQQPGDQQPDGKKKAETVEERLARIEKERDAERNAKLREEEDRQTKVFDDRFDKDLADIAKKQNVELLKRESDYVKRQVEDAFIADAEKSNPTLTLKDVQRLTQKAFDEVIADRRAILSKSVRRDSSPDDTSGGGSAQPKPQEKLPTKRERVDAAATDLKKTYEKTAV